MAHIVAPCGGRRGYTADYRAAMEYADLVFLFELAGIRTGIRAPVSAPPRGRYCGANARKQEHQLCIWTEYVM